MSKIHIINYLVEKYNYKKYLEIGAGDCSTFDKIKIDYKVGIDPNIDSEVILNKKSDVFFKENTEKFDIILIDGAHDAGQVYRDFINSLECLTDSGVIVCHNMLPLNEDMQKIPYKGGSWTGDCWKVFVHLKSNREDLDMFTIDIDYGISLTKKGNQNKTNILDEVNYENFCKNKSYWMDVHSILDFYVKMGEKDILKYLLELYINSPYCSRINFYMAVYYHGIGQTASAISYYLRAAERAEEDLLRYECLLRAAICFESQGCRNNSVEGMLQHAVALMPQRPEGYFYLSRFYERTQKWFNGYLIASIGEKVSCKYVSPLKEKLDYPGFYGIIFEKAICSWQTGLCEDSRNIFKYLSIYEPLDTSHRKAVIDNLKKLNYWTDESSLLSVYKSKDQELEASKDNLNLYYSENYNNLKHKFFNSRKINRNYSEAFQDIFILTLLDGKENGTYLEIGSGYPFYGNNTYLLESEFNWKGISLDIEPESSERYFRDREAISICTDAKEINYTYLLESCGMPKNIDYLQLDCDPPSVTYDILYKIPFDKYKFAIITYEHDYYKDETKSYKQKSRDFLKSKGYELVLSNISNKENSDFEDWYIHPELVNLEIVNKIKNIDQEIKIAKNIFLNSNE